MVEENEVATASLHKQTNGIEYGEEEPVISASTSNQQDVEASFRQKVEALLLCAVCHETATDPRQLNCGHFFCSECVDLLNVDGTVRCAQCSKPTPVIDEGVRKDELASRLLELLTEYPKASKKDGGEHEEGDNSDDVDVPVNGMSESQDSYSEGEEEIADMTASPDANDAPSNNGGSTTDEPELSNEEEPRTDDRPAAAVTISPVTANIAVETDTSNEDTERPQHSPEDNVSPQIQMTNSTDFTPVVTEEAKEPKREQEDRDETPPPPSPPPVETIHEQEPPADITIEPPPPAEMIMEPETISKKADEPVLQTEPAVLLASPQPAPESEVLEESTSQAGLETDVRESDEGILQPPVDYQSPEHRVDTLVNVEVHEPPPPISSREPVEHGVSDEEKPSSPTPDMAEKLPDLQKPEINEELVPETKDDTDETDYKMKASEIKPSDVATAIEMQRQCGTCHSNNCTCNTSSLLTPPVSMGSQQSVETNASVNVCEDDDAEILVEQLTQFPVKESASHIEVAGKNRIYVTRWTYDDNGAIETFDKSGNKVKCIHSGRYNYSGVTLSKLGFVFSLNTSKNRVEEYGSADGKKVKHFKLETCSDPQAVDIMPTGEVLVVDQERHRIVIYPNNKKSSAKPRAIKHSLLREPYDVAAINDCFYVTCAATRCLLKMDLEGNVLWSFGQSEDTRNKLKTPKGVCVDEVGLVYVVDCGHNCIYVINKDGQLKGKITQNDKVQMKQPWNVSVRDGLLAVLFSHNIVKTYQFV